MTAKFAKILETDSKYDFSTRNCSAKTDIKAQLVLCLRYLGKIFEGFPSQTPFGTKAVKFYITPSQTPVWDGNKPVSIPKQGFGNEKYWVKNLYSQNLTALRLGRRVPAKLRFVTKQSFIKYIPREAGASQGEMWTFIQPH